MRLTLYIKELLYKKDCVIVPDLGGFVAQYRSAFLHPSQHTFLPPSRRVAFNASLRTGDGLLAFHVASRLGLNYSEATEWIKEQVNGMWEKMMAGEKVILDDIGTFALDTGKRIQFEPDPNGNFLELSFGLSSLHSPAIRREEKPANVKRLKNESGKRNFKIWRLLELVPAAAVLALLLLNPRVISTLNTGLAELLPVVQWSNPSFQGPSPEKQAALVEEVVPEESPVESTFGQEMETGAPVDSVVPENSAHLAEIESTRVEVSLPVVSNAVVSDPSAVQAHDFHVVGGCFRVEENAQKLVEEAQLLGYSARIIGQNNQGLYMVSLYSSHQFSDVQDFLYEVRTGFEKNAWVLVK